MYLQKGTQFHGRGGYIGANENDELYKEIMAFMITSLKKTVPLVVSHLNDIMPSRLGL